MVEGESHGILLFLLNEVVEGIVGLHGAPGINESGERLLEMCAEQELEVGNSWFKKNDVYKYTWLRMAE